MMRYGLCAPLTGIQQVQQMGFDYIEPSLAALDTMPQTEYDSYQSFCRQQGFCAEVFNGFFPGAALRLTGAAVDMAAIQRYTAHVLARAAGLGAKTAVLGSGAARRLDGQIAKAAADDQFVKVLRLVGDVAQQYGITVCVEALNARECDYIVTVVEADALVQAAGHPNVKMMADIYHMVQNGEDLGDLARLQSPLVHLHMACPSTRALPMAKDGYDYMAIRQAVRACGYSGSISMEGLYDTIQDAAVPLDYMKKLFGD